MNTLKEKHTPSRRCLGCNLHFEKSMLVRIVRTPEEKIILDTTGRANGRGAYICKNAECLNKARRAGRIERSLKCKIPDEIYNTLWEDIIK